VTAHLPHTFRIRKVTAHLPHTTFCTCAKILVSMQKFVIRPKISPADIIVVALIGAVIYGMVSFGREWRSSFHPATDIDLSLYHLPYYTLFSGMRGLAAFLLSLAFTLVVGYWAAKSRRAEKVIIPLLDILQSIPVLGFLPGLVLALIAIFPNTNAGLELSSVIMIFTGQVWNMTFAYYSSLKSVPSDFNEVSKVIGLSSWEKLWRVEFPFSAMNLVWNSLMSMSGGWFFLSVCEAFTLGAQEYRLPGVGAYMAVAIARGDSRAMVMGIVAMATLIIVMDLVIWRPVLAWAQQYRLEEVAGMNVTEPLLNNLIRDSVVVRWFKLQYRKRRLHQSLLFEESTPAADTLAPLISPPPRSARMTAFLLNAGYALFAMTLALIGYGLLCLLRVLAEVSWATWQFLLVGTGCTFLRVVSCVLISSLWAVPVGIWIGTSGKRTRIAQPIIQVLASFPAPMLYPLALAVFFAIGIKFAIGSMFLMLLGVQWYVLFNVLAGAMRVPNELRFAAKMMGTSRWNLWKTLYIPSVFPALVTGWVTAAGGAWNASIVAEYLAYRGKVLTTRGLGSTISIAAETENFPMLAAALTVMVVLVIILNRSFWSRIYQLSQTRFRLDM
jgi:NitT/TauT family transport system permease protein